MDVAPLSALGVGQVGVVLGQTLLAIMPFVEAWWLFAAFRLRETVQIKKNVFGGGLGGKVVAMKEESDGREDEDEESEEVAAQTTRQDGMRTKWRRWPRSIFKCHCDWSGEDL
jgi:hypothetical protein